MIPFTPRQPKLSVIVITLIALILLFTGGQAQAKVTAELDRNQIGEGETVQLHIEVQGQRAPQPDTAPLQKDFDMVGTAKTGSYNFINGEMRSTTTWILTLLPKRAGNLTIPSLSVGNERTPEFLLMVNQAPTSSGGDAGDDLFLTSEVDTTTPYVQSMVRFTVRLYVATRLGQASLSDPQMDNAILRLLGKDRNYQETRNGRNYQVIERTYAIFPQASGDMTIPSLLFEGQKVVPPLRSKDPFRRDPFFSRFHTRTEPVHLRSKPQTLQVRPRPANADPRHWLPARNVELHENWQPAIGDVKNDYRVGSPITRTVTLTAEGLTGSQLPDIEFTTGPGLKVYPDQAQISDANFKDGLKGVKEQQFAFVPTAAGTYTLPPLRIAWWNTLTDRLQVAELPARTVTVLPAQGSTPTASTPPSQTALTTSIPESATHPIPVPPTHSSPTASATPWMWASGLFALLWLVTLAAWLRNRGSKTKEEPRRPSIAASPGAGTVKAARQAFRNACQNHDAKAARLALLAWASAHWPETPPQGLAELAQRLPDTKARQHLQELDRHLYGSGEPWQGNALAEALPSLPQEKHDKASARGEALRPLYPS